MLKPIDNYFIQQAEPVKATMLFLRAFILQQNKNITEAWKYGMPFYCYKGKMFCYLWTHKKYHQPYIGIVEGARIQHPALISEQRARMKILLINPTADIPIEDIKNILQSVIALYK
jgi:hypothetical protein